LQKSGKDGEAMGNLGMQEIIIVFILALIIFGPRKLPELGKTIGKGLAEFKKASNELKQTWEDEVRLDKEKEAITSIVSDVKEEVSFSKEKEAITEIVGDIQKDSSILPTEPPKNNDDSVGSKENQ
jgi:sec-independent protein translocase protein TatA